MREGALEILALLLLGFIAMLAIVPPIIRGKIEDSPLVTTQTFKKSMEEIGHSLEAWVEPTAVSRNLRADAYLAASSRNATEVSSRMRFQKSSAMAPETVPSTTRRRPVRSMSRRSGTKKAAIRRNRIFAALSILVLIWGMATLLSGSLWCLVAFSVSGFLLSFYWGLTIVMPYILLRSGGADREGKAYRGARKRQVA